MGPERRAVDHGVAGSAVPGGVSAAAVTETRDVWDLTYELLREYTKLHKTSRVPYDRTFKGVKLGHWVSMQRSNYAKGKLDRARQSRLEKLRGWKWQVT